MHRLTVLTGASRGMGAAMAQQLLRRDSSLLTISRNANADLTARAAAPGAIDTDMQARLRGADPARFPDHARFVALKASGQLDTAAAAAAKVLAYLERADFGEQPVADVRDA